jgi:hypothetical protein
MATSTKTETPAVDTDAVASEVHALADRIVTLRLESNNDAADELNREAETLISVNLKGNKRDIVTLRKTLRARVAEAMKTEALKSTEVAVAESKTVAEVEWLNELVDRSAENIRMVAETNVKGGLAVAQIMLDMRRRIPNKDGLPDLKASSDLAKSASKEVYARALSGLKDEGVSEDDDKIRKAVNKIQTDAQNAMRDLRVEYVRALDDEGNEDRELFAGIERKDGESLSEAVARVYRIRMMTRAEIEAERRANKELESGSAGGGEGDGEGETFGGDTEVGPVDAVATIVRKAREAATVMSADDIERAREANEIPAVDATQFADELEALIKSLSAIHAALS